MDLKMFEATLFMSLLYNITPHYLYFYSPRKSSHSKIVNSQKVVLDQHIGASSIFFIHSIILSIFFLHSKRIFCICIDINAKSNYPEPFIYRNFPSNELRYEKSFKSVQWLISSDCWWLVYYPFVIHLMTAFAISGPNECPLRTVTNDDWI